MPDLAAIRARYEAAEGPWTWRPHADGSKFADGTPVCDVIAADGTIITYDVGEPEARSIVAARTDLPDVVEALEEARTLLRELVNAKTTRLRAVMFAAEKYLGESE